VADRGRGQHVADVVLAAQLQLITPAEGLALDIEPAALAPGAVGHGLIAMKEGERRMPSGYKRAHLFQQGVHRPTRR
jgi:hypothetical protein